MDKSISERTAFVSPYLNRRLRSFDEVLEARQQIGKPRRDERTAPERGRVRLRLVYSRREIATSSAE